MGRKCHTQQWLENALKKLYKKVDSLDKESTRDIEKPRSHRKRKLNVPSLKIGDKKRKEEEKEVERENSNTETITPSEKLRQQTENNDEKFWNFVDGFFQSKPFHPRCKHGFFKSVKIPNIPKYKHLIIDENGVLRTEAKEEIALEERIFSKIQKIRMKKATDAIYKEVLEEKKESLKKHKHR